MGHRISRHLLEITNRINGLAHTNNTPPRFIYICLIPTKIWWVSGIHWKSPSVPSKRTNDMLNACATLIMVNIVSQSSVEHISTLKMLGISLLVHTIYQPTWHHSTNKYFLSNYKSVLICFIYLLALHYKYVSLGWLSSVIGNLPYDTRIFLQIYLPQW